MFRFSQAYFEFHARKVKIQSSALVSHKAPRLIPMPKGQFNRLARPKSDRKSPAYETIYNVQNGKLFQYTGPISRLSVWYYRLLEQRQRTKRWIRRSEVLTILKITSQALAYGIQVGLYPRPERHRPRVNRWDFELIRKIAQKSLADTKLEFYITKDEILARRLHKREINRQAVANIIARRNDEQNRRAGARWMSGIIETHLTSGAMTLVTVFLPQYVLPRDDLKDLDIPEALDFVREFLKRIGLGHIKAVGALDIVQIANVGWHKNPSPLWHVHVHMWMDIAEVPEATKRQAAHILKKIGGLPRSFHCKPVVREPVNTSYLLKDPNSIWRRIKPKEGPLWKKHYPLEGRDRAQVYALMGRVELRDWVYRQNIASS